MKKDILSLTLDQKNVRDTDKGPWPLYLLKRIVTLFAYPQDSAIETMF